MTDTFFIFPDHPEFNFVEPGRDLLDDRTVDPLHEIVDALKDENIVFNFIHQELAQKQELVPIPIENLQVVVMCGDDPRSAKTFWLS